MPNITSVTLTAGVPTAGSGTVGTLDNVTGTAGSPSVPVLTVQGVASGTPQPVSGTVAATQSGTWTVQPGNTPNTTAWKVDGSAVTQPVSGTVTANAGTNLNTSALALDATLTGGTQRVKLTDGTNNAAVKAASTAPVATDPALVVALSPNSVNANGRAVPANSAPVVLNSMTGTFVAASATATQLGSTGAVGDVLDGILVIPATAAAGAVSILWDGTNTRSVFAGGGTTALPTLAPFYIPLGFLSGNSGGFKITTGTNVSVICTGNFT